MRKRNLAPVSPFCFCRSPKHPSEHGEPDPGLRRKNNRRPLHLRSQASWLLRFGSSSPGTGPGRAGPSARAIASVDSAGCSAGQGGLRFPESRGWISWHDNPLTSQIPCTGSFLQVLSELTCSSERRKGKDTNICLGCLLCAQSSPQSSKVSAIIPIAQGRKRDSRSLSKQWRQKADPGLPVSQTCALSTVPYGTLFHISWLWSRHISISTQ